MYKKILIPTDGQKGCTDAVENGIRLAKTLKAKVVGVHVQPRLNPFEILEAYHPDYLWGRHEAEKAQESMEQVEKLHRSMGEHYLADLKKLADAARVDCETVFVDRETPAKGILKTADEKGCDLIFMSSHSREHVLGTHLGEVTSRVLATSRIPVLVYRCY
ncbi:MAG: universal stress protein [bacterium]|nr:MAG: universal stress protein [bacterium]